jgi:hypothetical protein
MIIENVKQTLIVSAFCGTGKTYFCARNRGAVEVECWKYEESYFPENCIVDIKSKLGEADVIFISTNPLVLNVLNKMRIEVILVYPERELKNEYMDRYRNRGSSEDFILTLSTYWNDWIKEIEENEKFRHIVLKSNQYISDVISTAGYGTCGFDA